MPCRDPRDDNVRIIDNTQTYKERRDLLARIACAALTRLEKMGVTADQISEEAADWFPKHKKADRARKRREAAEAAAEAARQAKEQEDRLAEELATYKRLHAKFGKTKKVIK